MIRPAEICGTESQTILNALVAHACSGVMSFIAPHAANSFARHCAARITLRDLDTECLNVEACPRKSLPSLTVAPGRLVDISVKYGYAKYLFRAEILTVRPAAEDPQNLVITLSLPDDVELVERRDYFRIHIPEIVSVGVILSDHCMLDSRQTLNTRVWKGRLIDISVGGFQVTVPMLDPERPHPAAGAAAKSDFAPGRSLHIRFVPFPYERPLEFDTHVTTVCETADQKFVCLGLRIADLSMNAYSRQLQRRLCSAIERYHDLRVTNANFHEMTPPVR